MLRIDHISGQRFKISCSELNEVFIIGLDDNYDINYYINDWKTEVKEFCDGNNSICLLFSVISNPSKSNFWKAWYVYKKDGGIFISEKILFIKIFIKIMLLFRLKNETSIRGLFRKIIFNDIIKNHPPSTWELTVDDLVNFKVTVPSSEVSKFDSPLAK